MNRHVRRTTPRLGVHPRHPDRWMNRGRARGRTVHGCGRIAPFRARPDGTVTEPREAGDDLGAGLPALTSSGTRFSPIHTPYYHHQSISL